MPADAPRFQWCPLQPPTLERLAARDGVPSAPVTLAIGNHLADFGLPA